MSSKLNIFCVIADHVATLVDDADGNHLKSKLSCWDVGVFFGLPAVIVLALFLVGLNLTDSQTGILISAFSLFAGLLINLLVLVYNVSLEDISGDETECAKIKRFIREIFANVSFCVLCSITGIVLLIVFSFATGFFSELVGYAILYVAIVFILSLLMVIKRIQKLFFARAALSPTIDDTSDMDEDPS